MLKNIENSHILSVLADNKNNKSATARELGITRKTLQKKLKAMNNNEISIVKSHHFKTPGSKFFTSEKIINKDLGYFYVIQLSPERLPHCVKLGFTTDLDKRLQMYRTSNPTAIVLNYYQCRKYWEKTLIDWITIATKCKRISNEVFEFENIAFLLTILDRLFSVIIK
jgi:hypothetical protein